MKSILYTKHDPSDKLRTSESCSVKSVLKIILHVLSTICLVLCIYYFLYVNKQIVSKENEELNYRNDSASIEKLYIDDPGDTISVLTTEEDSPAIVKNLQKMAESHYGKKLQVMFQGNLSEDLLVPNARNDLALPKLLVSNNTLSNFVLLYSEGVRYFFVSGDQEAIVRINEHVLLHNLTDISITYRFQLDRTVNLRALVSGYKLKELTPVVTEDNLWAVEAVKKIIGGDKKIHDTILVQYFDEDHTFHEDLDEGQFDHPSPVIVAVGDLLSEMMKNKRFLKFLKNRMVLVSANEDNINELLEDPEASYNSRKLNIITVLENKATPEPNREINSIFRNFDKNFRMIFPLRKFTIIRSIMLPNDIKGITYASKSPWFIDTRFTYEPEKDYLLHQEPVLYFYLKAETLLSQSTQSCASRIFTVQSWNYVLNRYENITWDVKDSKLVVIPHVSNIPVKISSEDCPNYSRVFHICERRNNSFELFCSEEGNNSNQTSLRFPVVSEKMIEDTHPLKRRNRRSWDYEANLEYTADVRWENFKSLVPQMLGCLGTTFGCSFCFIFLLYTTTNINPGVCMGACAVAIGGSCGTMFALGLQRVLHQTVICTELHRQGFMPLQAYIADANFGRKMEKQHPEAVDMYRRLATPVVRAMRRSRTFSSIVNRLSQPWRRHMEYEEGVRNEDDCLGRLLVYVGVPLLQLLHYINHYMVALGSLLVIAITSLYFKKNKL